jgi:methanogenic corrinoid protein MtbC1
MVGLEPGGAKRSEPSPESGMIAGASASDPGRFVELVRAIRANVIPKLFAVYADSPRIDPDRIAPEEIDRFLELIRRNDMALTRSFLRGMRERGVSWSTVLQKLVTPTARRLGCGWEDDSLGFADVSTASMRLEQLVLEGQAAGSSLRTADRTALFVSVPGDQHTLGILVAGDLLRREGWNVTALLRSDPAEILDKVRTGHFNTIGFGLSREALAGDLADLIRDVRRSSKNRGIVVMVGGRAFDGDPSLRARVGADLHARDAEDLRRRSMM